MKHPRCPKGHIASDESPCAAERCEVQEEWNLGNFIMLGLFLLVGMLLFFTYAAIKENPEPFLIGFIVSFIPCMLVIFMPSRNSR